MTTVDEPERAELKKQHHAEVTRLNEALSAAHGELLVLRRHLAPSKQSQK